MMKKLILLALGLVAAGCNPYFKDVASYNTMFRNDEVTGSVHYGDPYMFGGMGEATGGLMPRQSEATDTATPDPRSATAHDQLGEIGEPRTPTEGDLPGAGPALPGARAVQAPSQ